MMPIFPTAFSVRIFPENPPFRENPPSCLFYVLCENSEKTKQRFQTLTFFQNFLIRMVMKLLLFGDTILMLLLLFFGYSVTFPIGMAGFVFLSATTFLFALYRPIWAFLVFLSLLPFETLSLSPETIPLSLRPYQLLGGTLLLSIGVRLMVRHLPFSLFRFRWFDMLPVVFGLGGVFSIFFAPDIHGAAKQELVALSFVALYFLSRQFFEKVRVVRCSVPFLAISTVSSVCFALWQSARFAAGRVSFEVMPGRPNAFFSEPDWFGMFLIFSGSLALSLLFFFFERYRLGKVPKETLQGAEHEHAEPDRLARCQGRHFSWCSDKIIQYSGVTLFVFAMALGTISWLGLLLTVARSAWVGFILSTLLFLKLLTLGEFPWHPRTWRWKLLAQGSFLVSVSLGFSLFTVWAFQLTTFNLADRAGSTASTEQKITVSCEAPGTLPKMVGSISELSAFGCRFIRLEEIPAEQLAGRFISTVLRPDPSIEARRMIGRKTLAALRSNWLFGIGWGSVGHVLGTDDRGTALNASNAFVEAWLGGGMMSGISFLVLWILIPIRALRKLFERNAEADHLALRAIAVFFLISWVGGTVFNLFNSGIFLGFVWVWLGGIALLDSKEK